MDTSDEVYISGGKRLAVGDRLRANPCDVKVTEIGDRGAWGWCSTCKAAHALDLPLYERGLGPWRLVDA